MYKIQNSNALLFCVLASTSCSLNQRKGVDVYVEMPREATKAQLASSPGTGLVSDLMSSLEPRSSGSTFDITDVSSFDCFFFNVIGPGIGGYSNSPYSSSGNTCSYTGVMSTKLDSSHRSAVLQLPPGPGREIQYLGVKTSDGSCGTYSDYPSLQQAYFSPSAAQGAPPPKWTQTYVVGRQKGVDLFQDTSVTVNQTITFSGPNGGPSPDSNFPCADTSSPPSAPSLTVQHGLKAWFQASSFSNLADGASTTNWLSSMGSLGLAPSATPPLYSAKGGPNGQPAVVFDSANLESFSSGNVALGSNISDLSIFVVGSADTSGVLVSVCRTSPCSAGNQMTIQFGTYWEAYVFDSVHNPYTVETALGSPLDSKPHIHYARYHGDATVPASRSLSYQVSGMTAPTPIQATASLDFTNTYISLGVATSATLEGSISEVLIYTEALSDADVQSIQAYLSTKYSISP